MAIFIIILLLLILLLFLSIFIPTNIETKHCNYQKKVRNYEIDTLYENLEKDKKLLDIIKKEYPTGNDMLENTLKIEIEKLKARISDLEH